MNIHSLGWTPWKSLQYIMTLISWPCNKICIDFLAQLSLKSNNIKPYMNLSPFTKPLYHATYVTVKENWKILQKEKIEKLQD